MAYKMTRRLLALSVWSTLFLLTGCGQLGIGFTKIGDLLASPKKYSERDARIGGDGDQRAEASDRFSEMLFDSRRLRRDHRLNGPGESSS